MIREARTEDVPEAVAAYEWLFAPPGIRPERERPTWKSTCFGWEL